MLSYFFFSPYELVVVPGILLAMWAQFRLRSAYADYSQVGTESGMTGGQAAREILDRNGLRSVPIEEVAGELTDHYDPTKKTVFLSTGSYHGNSVASVGVAAHEVGHALQHKEAYGPLGLRMALVPVTGISSQMATIVVFVGLILTGMKGLFGLGSILLWGGIGLFSVMAFFQLVTLPVEYDASRRAKEQLVRLGMVSDRERGGVENMLNAAALTYVAALATSLLVLLKWILIARNRDDNR